MCQPRVSACALMAVERLLFRLSCLSLAFKSKFCKSDVVHPDEDESHLKYESYSCVVQLAEEPAWIHSYRWLSLLTL